MKATGAFSAFGFEHLPNRKCKLASLKATSPFPYSHDIVLSLDRGLLTLPVLVQPNLSKGRGFCAELHDTGATVRSDLMFEQAGREESRYH